MNRRPRHLLSKAGRVSLGRHVGPVTYNEAQAMRDTKRTRGVGEQLIDDI